MANAIERGYGSKVVGEVTLDQVYGGARGIKSLVWEVTLLRLQPSKSVVDGFSGFSPRLRRGYPISRKDDS